MTLQEQMTVRTKAQLGLASEAELVALLAEAFDARIVDDGRPTEYDIQRCFTCGCVEGDHATWCSEAPRSGGIEL